MRSLQTVFTCFFLLLFALNAQLTRGFISGTVQDATGSAISQVSITITNTATGIQRNTVSNDAGVYRFVGVEPGAYVAEFSKSGFETTKLTSIQVGGAQEVVLNPVLTVGQVTTTIEVQETPPGVVLAKSTATFDRKLDQQLVDAIPTTGLGRDVTRLALLAPTVVRATGSNEFSSNGQRARNNNFTIDGVDNNDNSVSLPAARIIPEMVGEFQIQTNSYSAEFGRNTGAQISVITRAGTNQFHGSVYDFYAANWMEPLTLQNKRAGGKETPRFNQNQAGGSLGGPIQRDKTFFFGLMEANRRREAPSADNAATITIPTPVGYSALSGVPLATNQPTQSRQAVLSTIGFLPEIHAIIPRYDNITNVTANGVPIQVGSARIPIARPANFWYAVARIDHQLTSRDSLSYRNQFDYREQPNVASNLGFGERFAGGQSIQAYSHALSHIHTFSPSLTNEFRFAFSRRNLAFPESDPVSPTVGVTGLFTVGGASNFPQARVQNTFQFQNVSTYMRGRHAFKMGGDLRRIQLYDLNGFDSKGTWAFNSLQDYLNNNAFRVTRASPVAQSDSRQNLLYFFFQDDIKVTRDLTVTLGLRYEYTTFPFGFFGATDPAVRAVGVPGPAKADKNNWAPRAGLAYSPTNAPGLLGKLLGNGQTVLRGGYGVGYDVIFLNLLSNTESNYPNAFVDNQFNLVNVYPTLPPVGGATLNPAAQFANAPEDAQNPTSHFYSFSIQRQFARNYVFEIGYSGSRSYHQIRQNELNYGVVTPAQAQQVIAAGNANVIPGAQARRLNPNWGSRILIDTSSNAAFNSGFLRIDKRLSRGLLIGANYTYSGLFSDNDESLAVAGLADGATGSPIPQDYRNLKAEWSRSSFDRPHRFVIHYSYNTPWIDGGQAFWRHVFKDWNLGGFSEWQSGQPFSIRTGVDSTGNGRTDNSRPDLNASGVFSNDIVEGNLRTFTSPLTGGRYITPLGANGAPLPASTPFGGNLGRNTLRAPGFTQWNFSLGKTFSVTERLKIRVRNDFINLFNHRNFGVPENRLAAPTFGQNTRAQVSQANRTMLMSAKIIW